MASANSAKGKHWSVEEASLLLNCVDIDGKVPHGNNKWMPIVMQYNAARPSGVILRDVESCRNKFKALRSVKKMMGPTCDTHEILTVSMSQLKKMKNAAPISIASEPIPQVVYENSLLALSSASLQALASGAGEQNEHMMMGMNEYVSRILSADLQTKRPAECSKDLHDVI